MKKVNQYQSSVHSPAILNYDLHNISILNSSEDIKNIKCTSPKLVSQKRSRSVDCKSQADQNSFIISEKKVAHEMGRQELLPDSNIMLHTDSISNPISLDSSGGDSSNLLEIMDNSGLVDSNDQLKSFQQFKCRSSNIGLEDKKNKTNTADTIKVNQFVSSDKEHCFNIVCKPMKIVLQDFMDPGLVDNSYQLQQSFQQFKCTSTNIGLEYKQNTADTVKVNQFTSFDKQHCLNSGCKPLKIVLQDCMKQTDVVTSYSNLETDNTTKSSVCKTKSFKTKTPPGKRLILKTKKTKAKTLSKELISRHRDKLLCTIPRRFVNIFLDFERSVMTEDNIQNYSQRLLDKFTEIPDRSEVQYYVLQYLSVFNKNPLRLFKETHDLSIFLHPIERCVVSVLNQLYCCNTKLYLKGFLRSFAFNIRQLLLGMKSINVKGCCSLSRVYTHVFKLQEDKVEPLKLCCDLLKTGHRFSPMMIACIVGVWPQLFEITCDASDEEIIFHSALALGSQKCLDIESNLRSKFQLDDTELELSSYVLQKLMSSSPIQPTSETIDLLLNAAVKRCSKSLQSEVYLLTSSIVIFAAHKGSEWAKNNVVKKHLIPKIKHFSETEQDEEALTMFCNLYSEVCSFFPECFSPEYFLFKLFDNEDTDGELIQDCVAPALIQLLLSRNNLLPERMKKWLKKQSNNPKFSSLKLVFHKALLGQKADFLKDDIL